VLDAVDSGDVVLKLEWHDSRNRFETWVSNGNHVDDVNATDIRETMETKLAANLDAMKSYYRKNLENTLKTQFLVLSGGGYFF
jgi:hypothetical protein